MFEVYFLNIDKEGNQKLCAMVGKLKGVPEKNLRITIKECDT